MLWNCCSYLKKNKQTCICGGTITAGLKLHLVTWICYYTILGLIEKSGTLCSVIPMLENAQPSGCTLSKFNLRKHFSLQPEPVLILPKFWAVPKEHSICSISDIWYQSTCALLCMCSIQIYCLATSLLIHSCHAGKANFLQCVAERCTMHAKQFCVFSLKKCNLFLWERI